MLIIGIETSNGKCSVALSNKDEIISALYNSENSKQAEYLTVMTQEVMQNSSFSFCDLEFIAVSVGPGSFTGIRIGIAAAKGLGLALGKKVIGVTNFETIFYRIGAQVKDSSNKLAIINAYRDELYIAEQIEGRNNDGHLIHKSELAKFNRSDVVIAGSGAYEASFGEILPRFPIPDARIVCKVAYEKVKTNDFTEAVPLYIRHPDAKL